MKQNVTRFGVSVPDQEIFFRSFLILLSAAFVVSSCAISIPPGQGQTEEIAPAEVVPPPIQLPAGWGDITSRSQLSDVKLWLTNRDNSAAMILRELHTEDSTRALLQQEDPCFLSNISLRLKIADSLSSRRITRTPAVLDSADHLCSYVYSEKGLLRRVIVFAGSKAFYELELMQVNADQSFDALTNDEVGVVKELMKR